jgi:hypothetical protein
LRRVDKLVEKIDRLQISIVRTAFRLYRSLRAVKVLLAALCSTLTVLTPRGDVRIGSRWRSSCRVLIINHASPGERNSSKLLRDTRFDSFEFFLRHWPACPFFNEMIEQDFSSASFAPIG